MFDVTVEKLYTLGLRNLDQELGTYMKFEYIPRTRVNDKRKTKDTVDICEITNKNVQPEYPCLGYQGFWGDILIVTQDGFGYFHTGSPPNRLELRSKCPPK